MTTFQITHDPEIPPPGPKVGDLMSLIGINLIVMVFEWPGRSNVFSGTVIAGTDGATMGHFSKNWEKSQFTPFKGTVELKS